MRLVVVKLPHVKLCETYDHRVKVRHTHLLDRVVSKHEQTDASIYNLSVAKLRHSNAHLLTSSSPYFLLLPRSRSTTPHRYPQNLKARSLHLAPADRYAFFLSLFLFLSCLATGVLYPRVLAYFLWITGSIIPKLGHIRTEPATDQTRPRQRVVLGDPQGIVSLGSSMLMLTSFKYTPQDGCDVTAWAIAQREHMRSLSEWPQRNSVPWERA